MQLPDTMTMKNRFCKNSPLLPDSKDDRDVSHFAVLGLRFVEGEIAGLSYQEDEMLVLANTPNCIPHSILDEPCEQQDKATTGTGS